MTADQVRESHPAPAPGADPCPAISILFVQIREVYDGTLIFRCEVCGAEWPRFEEGDWRHDKALEIIAERRGDPIAPLPEPTVEPSPEPPAVEPLAEPEPLPQES